MSTLPQPTRRAVIDVGTNSVKLLVADVGADTVTPVLEQGEQTRLGRGFYETHRLQPDAIALTASVIDQFARQAVELGAASVRPFATSAARDARNADELRAAVQQASGLQLTVISGETEAEWAFQGAITNPRLKGHAFLLIDVGGGSTEFILGENGHRRLSRSYNLGTVRTLEALPHGDPPQSKELDAYRQWIAHRVREGAFPEFGFLVNRLRPDGSAPGLRLAATGGTASILAAMDLQLTVFDRDRIESISLPKKRVTHWVETLWGMPLAERRQLPGLPPPRADVMLAGVVIFEAILEAFDFRDLCVSTRGVRFAALRELWGGSE